MMRATTRLEGTAFEVSAQFQFQYNAECTLDERGRCQFRLWWFGQLRILDNGNSSRQR